MKKQFKKITLPRKRGGDVRSDAELVAAFLKGEQQCFAVIEARHRPRLRPHLCHLLHNSDLTDDALQETFTAAFIEISNGQYCEQGFFATWLSNIANNQAMRIIRTEHHYVHVKEFESFDQQQESNTNTLEEDEEKKFLLRLFDILPEQTHKILEMIFIRSMNTNEVGLALHLKPDSVRKCCRRAFRKLKKVLASRYGSKYSEWKID